MVVAIRAYEEGDRGPVVRLLAGCLPYDRMDEGVFADRILRDPDFDPALNLVAAADGQVMGFVAGASANEHLQCPAGVKLFAVAPEWRQRGVATRLFDELGRAAAGHGGRARGGDGRGQQSADAGFGRALHGGAVLLGGARVRTDRCDAGHGG